MAESLSVGQGGLRSGLRMSHVTQAGVVPPLQHNCSAAQTISHSSVVLPKNQRESTSVLLLSRQEPSLRLRPARSGTEAWAACHGVTLFHTLLSTHPQLTPPQPERLPNGQLRALAWAEVWENRAAGLS